MKSLIKTTFILLILTGITTAVSAQQSENVQIEASANVEANVDMSSGNNLNFGNITTETNSTVLPSDGNAGTFNVSGNVGNVDLGFDLPSVLTGNGEELTINFGNNSASWGDNAYDSNNEFNPNEEEASVNLLQQDNRDITVFIGGTVEPTATQAAGSYTGTIILTATYN